MRKPLCSGWFTATAVAWALLAPRLVLGQSPGQRVKTTVHNLSVSGPGALRAVSETEVCVFCHTPHGSRGVRPLWNRAMPAGPYLIYQSTSLKATPGQPTGSSKLCLSCHDGTIALGDVLDRPAPISMAGSDRIPQGPTNLGTDLSDDHPISFPYASSLSGGATEFLQASAITPPVRLDAAGEVQCTSCHEPHDNTYGDFLLRPNDSGALCTSCHDKKAWDTSIHATSPEVLPAAVAAVLGAPQVSVAENACGSCHRTHGAGSVSWLVHLVNISSTCLQCHDGTVAAADIERELTKLSGHGILTQGPGTPSGGPYLEGSRLSCADCHDSHQSGNTAGIPAGVPPSLAGVSGVAINGAAVPQVSHQYELCLRCHGDTPADVTYSVSRVIFEPNKRLQFQPTNPSFHAIGSPGVNSDVPSLLPPYTAASTIDCADCHASDDSRRAGGSGPAGPHGSVFDPLLVARYERNDFATESAATYALCYRCHIRNSILSDNSFKEHRKHIVKENAPCSVCHDPHGIPYTQGNSTNNAHLINFDRSVVSPNRDGRLEFRDLGRFRGECYLSCHGEDHRPERYGPKNG